MMLVSALSRVLALAAFSSIASVSAQPNDAVVGLGNATITSIYDGLSQAEIEVGGEFSSKEEVEKLLLTGWWSDCDFDEPSTDESCAGGFNENNTPEFLDASGATCYVKKGDLNANAVTWFAEVPEYVTKNNYTDIHAYSMILTDEAVAAGLMPTDCNSNGACVCGDAFNGLRAGWDDPNSEARDFCKDDSADTLHQCIVVKAKLMPRTCNVFIKVRGPNNEFKHCVFNAALELESTSTTSPSPTGAPTGSPTDAPDSGAGSPIVVAALVVTFLTALV